MRVRQIVSVLFNEPKLLKFASHQYRVRRVNVSVLFNEPKLLKFPVQRLTTQPNWSFSALQRAEIAEISTRPNVYFRVPEFQCSSTSRNC